MPTRSATALGCASGHERSQCVRSPARTTCCRTVAAAIETSAHCRLPAPWLPGRRRGRPAMKTRVRKTLLQSLMIERHLTREQVIEVLDRRARDMGVRDFALSLRQLDRWLAGDLATLPRPSLCRVVEAEFGYPVQRLLALAGDLVDPSSTPQAQAPRAHSTVASGEVESVLDVTARMGWLGSVNA